MPIPFCAHGLKQLRGERHILAIVVNALRGQVTVGLDRQLALAQPEALRGLIERQVLVSERKDQPLEIQKAAEGLLRISTFLRSCPTTLGETHQRTLAIQGFESKPRPVEILAPGTRSILILEERDGKTAAEH